MRFALLTALLLAGTPAYAQSVERLTILSNGDVVGSIAATSNGNRTSVDYQVSNNGRGPKHREDIEFTNAMPIRWTVAGTSMMGGPVAEQFQFANGVAQWSSQADKGEARRATPALYILNDDSPYALGVYARAALSAHGKPIEVLPGGRLTVTRLKDLTTGKDRKTRVTMYRLSGVQLEPDYILLDDRNRLFATLSRETAIRAGYESEVDTLKAVARDEEAARLKALSASITHRYEVPVRIRNVHVLDPVAKTRGPLSTVVVMRDRISAILPGDGGTPPADQVVIDGAGGTLYPGLHDMHSHATATSGLFYLAAGVTGTRDLGNDNAFLQGLLPQVDAGTVASPRIVADGFIEGAGPYAARNGFVVKTLDEGLDAVRWYGDRNYRAIKIYNSMNPAFVKPLADEAKRRGMGVGGHIPAFMTPDQAILDGYGAIAHVNQLMLGWLLKPGEDTRTPLRLTAMARGGTLDLTSAPVQHTVALMQEHKVALDTTAVILERLMLSRAGTVGEADAFYLSHMPIGYQRYRQRTFVPIANAADDQAYQTGFAKVIDVIRLLHDKGIVLLPGTDDATGFTVQREVELYSRAMSNGDAIKAATWDAEAWLGNAHQAGSIERGKLAEMVLTAGDPLTDITALRRPSVVFRGGGVYFPAEIYRALDIAPFAPAPTVTLPKAAPAAAAAAPAGALFGGHDDDYDHD